MNYIMSNFYVDYQKKVIFVVLIIKSKNIMEVKMTLDCKGLSCPMPILKVAKAMKDLKSGEVLEMLGTDPGTKTDLPNWCTKTGNEILEITDLDGGVTKMLVKKA